MVMLEIVSEAYCSQHAGIAAAAGLAFGMGIGALIYYAFQDAVKSKEARADYERLKLQEQKKQRRD